MHKYLVTGGAGFIGSHIVQRLLKDGHFVRVLDNLFSGKLQNLSFTQQAQRQAGNTQYEFIKGDIRDISTCKRACRDIDFVLHQAALRSVPKSLENPAEYNDVNINGVLNMLEAARAEHVKRFVFASSSSIYGETEIFPQKEEHLPNLISPYALTKLTGEYYCRIYSKHYGFSTVCLRYFNVFGPRQALDDEYSVVIPKFITCILNDQQPPIFGNGKQSRDFTYIDNVVQANILAATHNTTEGGPERSRGAHDARGNTNSGVFHEVFNIANGRDNSVLELVDTLNNILNKDIKPQLEPVRPGDVFRTLADISKAKERLGYQPEVDFEQGLIRTVDWFRKQLTH